jgi:uncharacterized membrane protein YfcA
MYFFNNHFHAQAATAKVVVVTIAVAAAIKIWVDHAMALEEGASVGGGSTPGTSNSEEGQGSSEVEV